MAPLGWSGGSQFSSTVLPVDPVTVSMRGGEGAVGTAVDSTQMQLRKERLADPTCIGAYVSDRSTGDGKVKYSLLTMLFGHKE